MLLSIGLIIIVGFFAGFGVRKIGLPPLVGYLAVGIALGPYALGWLSEDLLGVSAVLRQIALVVILLRAGLTMDVKKLRALGRPALLLCFVPASFEILGTLLFAPKLLGLSLGESAVLGTVLGAVSPAVVVPSMVRLQEEGWGTKAGIPQLVMAGASLDDIFVLVLFSSFLAVVQTGETVAFSLWRPLWDIGTSIVLGIGGGLLIGWLLVKLFSQGMNKTGRLLIVLGAALLLTGVEEILSPWVAFSGLLAVIAMAAMIHYKNTRWSGALSTSFGAVWNVFEILLFALVGASVNLPALAVVSGSAVLLLGLSLLFRMAGVFLSLLGTPLTGKERFFVMLAYTPKATVQAAIGGIPLAVGLPGGEKILAVAVLSILLTAPLGAFAIEKTHATLLVKEKGS